MPRHQVGDHEDQGVAHDLPLTMQKASLTPERACKLSQVGQVRMMKVLWWRRKAMWCRGAVWKMRGSKLHSTTHRNSPKSQCSTSHEINQRKWPVKKSLQLRKSSTIKPVQAGLSKKGEQRCWILLLNIIEKKTSRTFEYKILRTYY